jgi:hypothetical protein
MKALGYLLLVSVSLPLMGCGQQLQDFVRVPRDESVPGQQIPKGSGALEGVKLSTGTVTAKGTSVGVQATITATDQQLKGTTIGARVGISRSSINR